MSAAETWRELLAEIIRDPQERERIVRELNVHPITLNRWMNNEATPRLDNLRRLLNILPEQKKQLFDFLIREFPDIAFYVENNEPLYEITSDFYTRVFNIYVTTPLSKRFWSLGKLVLQYLLEGLDPQREHVAILLLQCHPSSNGVVRSLRLAMGVGTPPWKGNLDTHSLLFGAESFPGHVLLSASPTLIENTEDYTGHLPVSKYFFLESQPPELGKQSEFHLSDGFSVHRMASEMAVPVSRADRRVGVLYACSTKSGFFRSAHLQFLRECATLVVLALTPEDFYSRQDIVLHMLPPPWIQIPLLMQIPYRILQLMQEVPPDQPPLDRKSAERLVWQQVEDELIARGASGPAT